ncbi:hypothetical protein D3C81_1724820 [compost metagenome]
MNLINASGFQLLDQVRLAFLQIIDQSVFERNSVTQHHIADIGHFVLHRSGIEDKSFQREVIDTGLPAVEHIVSFLWISRILTVQRRIPAPVREPGVIRSRRTSRVFVITFRDVVGSGDAIHRQVMNFLVILQQIDQHQGTFCVLRSSMDRHAVLCRDSGDFFLIRC